MATISVEVKKGEKIIEIAAEDALRFITSLQGDVNKGGPGALAALAVVLSAVDKALVDGTNVANNPASLVLSFATDVADVKAVWPAVKQLAASLGIKL